MVNYSLPEQGMEEKLSELVKLLLTSGPKAVSQCKALIEQVANHLTLEEAKEFTAEMIARIRMSEEGQEGMAAFLEKRKPRWVE
jgi:methylglutaconyl-CoA hydratase